MISDLEVPGELPETAAAWRAQQARWTKGHAQCARKLLPLVWASEMPLWKKAAMTLQMCQFAFYTLAFASAAISPDPDVYGRGLLFRRGAAGPDRHRCWGWPPPSAISISASACWAATASHGFIAPLLLAVVFPSGLILANTRATFEAFFSTRMDFNRTTAGGREHAGGWRGVPELIAGVLLPVFAFAESGLERAVLLLRGLRPGFHRRHGRFRRARARPPAHHARRVSTTAQR